jgi:hypothetical protein
MSTTNRDRGAATAHEPSPRSVIARTRRRLAKALIDGRIDFVVTAQALYERAT